MKSFIEKFGSILLGIVGIYLLAAFLFNLFIAYKSDQIPISKTSGEEIVKSARFYLENSKLRKKGRDLDCSSFTREIYQQAGIEIPSNVLDQYNASVKREAGKSVLGDLVFFNISGNTMSHVGILLSDSTFIHSPGKGKDISEASLNEAYWKSRVVAFAFFEK